MLRIIDANNRHLFTKSVDQLFRLRHDCFVKERGWSEFDRDGVHELDQYDDDNAKYAVVIDQDTVVGSMRIYPSTLPHMLSEVFPHLIDGLVPQRHDIIELSRLAIAPGRRGGQTYHELILGLQEYCVQEEVSAVTAVMRMIRMPIIQKFGFKITPLGLPQQCDDDTIVAVRMDIDAGVLSSAKRRLNISGDILENANVRKVA